MSRGRTDKAYVPLGGAPPLRLKQGTSPRADQSPVDALCADLEYDALKGLWLVQGLADAPATAQPHVWRREIIRRYLDRAGEVMNLADSPVRRALLLWNPGARDHWDATNTLTAAVQMMMPGETVTTHRHIHSAMRFITHGNGATTTVNGERISLGVGDLVLTPNWHWHDHANESSEPVIWMDGLDRTLVKLLDAIYFEVYPGGGYQPVTRTSGGPGDSQAGNFLPPPGETDASRFSPQFAYRWDDTWNMLRDLEKRGEASPFDDLVSEFRNPVNGGHVTPTMGCVIQMLRPGVHTRAHQHSSSAVYHVFRGRGWSVIDGKRHDWSEGDYFALPGRLWHEHANASASDPAILFSITDVSAFEALALLREEAYAVNGGRQQEG